jgi:hypothetical protein
MLVTWLNFQTILPKSLWEKFTLYAAHAYGRAIIYKDGALLFRG